MKLMDQQIAREIGIHGSRWRTLHGGYFANSKVALPLIKAIKSAIAISSPAVVVDLGGGTGFILRELLKQDQYPGVRFVDVDLSETQLKEERNPRISCLRASVSEITRDLFDTGNRPLLFVMRSLLHYFGRTGLCSLLEHLRSQMKAGEFLVHQTACFEHECDAQRLKLIYKRMRTDKWYPLISELKAYLKEEGWTVHAVCPAAKLLLTSHDLAERYRLSEEEVCRIRDEISQLYGEAPEVFVVAPNGFTAYLHYQIFTCAAI